MKICFVLPQMLRFPIGGYKIVYEYANRLVREGHEVSIGYLNKNALKKLRMPFNIKKKFIALYTAYEPRWFELDKRITKISIVEDKFGYDCDLMIATGADTVEFVKRNHVKSKAYFIQGYENWLYQESELQKTYSIGLDNIVVSSWLKKIVDQYSVKESLLIKNPLDIKSYRIINATQNRDLFTIGALYSPNPVKGFSFTYEIIIRMKELYPKLKVKLFGTSRPNFQIPEWIEFTFNATQEETIDIYNKISFFISTSINEGFGLTGLEAMACGGILISFSNEGVKEYAVNDYNSILVEIGKCDQVINAFSDLLLDREKRERLIKNGQQTVVDFSWEKSMHILNEYLESINE